MSAFVDYSICLFTFTTQDTHSCVKTTPHGATQLPLMSPPLTPSTSSSSQQPKEGYRCEVSLLFEVYQNQ
ncbi:hypothetical protein MBANPS3_008319, partial [Mucor bainieri]